MEWFISQGHYCHKCSEEIRCPNCGNLKVENQGYEVYVCRKCSYQLKQNLFTLNVWLASFENYISGKNVFLLYMLNTPVYIDNRLIDKI